MESIGGSMRRMGTQMVAVGAVMGGGLAGAVIQAGNFQETMANIGSILGRNQGEMIGLSREIREIGAASRYGPQVAATAFYDIVSGVADASTHMHIFNAAIATAEAGNAELKSTTAAMIAVMNSYNFAAKDAAFVSDVMTRAVQTGVLTMDQLAAAIPSVTGMAKSMGIEFDTLAAMMAFMTTKGVSASESSTLLRGSMTALLNPTSELQRAIESIGFESGEAMVAALGLAGSYEAIKEFGGGSFAGLITSQEALRGALILTDESAEEFFANFKAGVDGATEAARAIQMESFNAKFDLAKAGVQNLAIVIGDALLPSLTKIMEKVGEVLPKITAWVEANPELVKTIAMVAGGLVTLGTTLIGLGIILPAIGNGFAALTGIIKGVGAAIMLLTSPIAAGIALGVALWLAWENNWGNIRQVVADAVAFIGQKLQEAAATATMISAIIFGVLSTAANAAHELVAIAFAGIATAADTARNLVIIALGLIATFVNETLIPTFQGFSDFMGTLWTTIQPFVQAIVDGIMTGFGFVIDVIIPGVQTAFQGFIDFVGNIWNAISGGITALTQGLSLAFLFIRNIVIQPVETTIRAVISALQTIWDSVRGGVEAFAAGIQTALGPVIAFINDLRSAINDVATALGNLDRSGSGRGGAFGTGIGPDFDPLGGLRDIVGGASGIAWSGSGPINEPAGIFHRQESVVPAHGMRVIPSPRGLMLEGGGGGGGGIRIDNLTVQANDLDHLYDQIQRIARQRA